MGKKHHLLAGGVFSSSASAQLLLRVGGQRRKYVQWGGRAVLAVKNGAIVSDDQHGPLNTDNGYMHAVKRANLAVSVAK